MTKRCRASAIGYLKGAQVAAAVWRYESGHINYLPGEPIEMSRYRRTPESCDEIVDGAINVVDVVSNVADAPGDIQERALLALEWLDEDMHRLG